MSRRRSSCWWTRPTVRIRALHRNLRKALPNAAIIGFTGTPILSKEKTETREIFGDFIDKYILLDSELDGAIVPILYEGRTADGLVKDAPGLDQLFEDMFQEYAPDELARWTRSKLLWVHRKLLKKTDVLPRVRQPEFVSGESFSYLGKNYRLKILRGAKDSFSFDGKNFVLSPSARSKAADHFRRWYIHTGSAWLRDRVSLLSRKLGVSAKRLYVRDLGYEELGDEVIARFNPKTGEIENLEVLIFSTRLLRSDLFELPVTADLRLAGKN